MPNKPHVCSKNINRNSLLELFFNESEKELPRDIREHIDSCDACRDYLVQLREIDNSLDQWQDEAPSPGIFDLIMTRIDANASTVQAKPRLAASTAREKVTFAPLILLILSILTILGAIFLLHNNLTLLPVWETLKNSWFVDVFGSFGVTAFLFFLFGLLVTLSIAPVLILEAKSKKYRYYFS